MISTTTAFAALLLASAQAPQQAPVPATTQSAALEADKLAEGQSFKAIAALEKRVEAAPEDPALLINLGIAHAQAGDANMARAMFERALVSPDHGELEIADGSVVDSRRLARKAMRMLDRNEFTTRLTRRD